MPNTATDHPIRLLHLSDIHFTAGKAWDADPVLRALAKFIRKEVDKGLDPDLVIISGDLAFAGKAEEYQLARDWLDKQLWPALPAGFSHDRLLLVPGNHDVDRGQIGKGVRHIQDGLLRAQTQDEIASLMKDESERQVVLKRHAAYLDFYGQWLGEVQPLPWWQRSIEIRGQRLHVAGLDSAWMACGDEDRGRLLLSRWQINQTVVTREAEGANWRIALLHHPWDYLAEFDTHEARQSIHLHRDLLLRGHLHKGEASFVRPPDPDRACLELAAGCIYEESDHPNAFQWIELHPRPRCVKVLFRTWIQGAWTINRNQPGCPNGEARFVMSPKPAHGDEPGRSPPVEAPNRTIGDIHKAAVAAITESLELVPTFCVSLSKQPAAGGATTAAEIAKWLCAPQDDGFRHALSAFRVALPDAARQKQGDVSVLREKAHDILGWMVVTTVLDGYDREDASLVQAWFDGAAFRIPLGRSPCLEVLTARWRRRKAKFGPQPDHWDYGPDDITPRKLGEIGFDDLNRLRLDPSRARDCIWRLIYQQLEIRRPPDKLHDEELDEIRNRLDIQLKEKGSRRRLVIDSRELDSTLNFPSILSAIHDDIPQIHLIVMVGPAVGSGSIFLLPASELSANIKESLVEIGALV